MSYRKSLGSDSAAAESGARKIVDNNTDGQSFKPSPPNPQAAFRAGPTSSEQVAQAATALLDALVAQRHFQNAGEKFVATSGGIDQRRIIRYAAFLTWRRLGSRRCPTLHQFEAELWRDAGRIFGWKNLADLEVGGRA